MRRTFRALALFAATTTATVSTVAMSADMFDPSSSWLLGDWGGERQALLDKGYDLTFQTVGEMGSNLGGGYNQHVTARWSDQVLLGASMDLQKLLGWEDATFRVSVTERNGQDITNARVRQPDATGMTSTMEIYGGPVAAWRMSQLWYEQKFFDHSLAIKLGRFAQGEDFNGFPCQFQNLTLCGGQEGNWNGSWDGAPVSQWAGRVKYNFTPEFAMQIGAYNKNPNNADTNNGFKPFIGGSTGTTFPIEAIWKGRIDGLASEYHAGYYYAKVKTADDLKDANGNYAAITGQPYRVHSGNDGWWVSAQQQLTTVDGAPDRGLSVFTSFTKNGPNENQIERAVQLGMVYTGPFDSRPSDTIGIGAARLRTNDSYTQNAELLNSSNGITNMDDPAYAPVQGDEYSYEVNYGIQATKSVMIRPNLQYVKYPGGIRETPGAVIGGVQIIANF